MARSTFYSSASLLLLLSSLVPSVQSTYLTSCNPLKESSCPSDTGLNANVALDFSSESKSSPYFEDYSGTGTIGYSDDGLSLTLAKRFDNPSLKSKFYIMFGRMEIIAKAAPGTGIVSTIYLQSDDLDEIDWEWLGGDSSTVQTNFFSKGDTTTYDRGQYNNVNGDPTTGFHNYTLDWSMDQTNWYIDNVLVRTLLNNTSSGYPQSPMSVYMGVWAGGDASNSEGTIQWAGGATDYSKAPFAMNIKSLRIADYSSGSSYSYSGSTGSWDSLKVTGGSINGRKEEAIASWDGSSSSTSSSTSSSSASTSSASTSTSSSSSSSTSMFSSVSSASSTSSTSLTSSSSSTAESSLLSSDSSSTISASSSITASDSEITTSATASSSSSSSSIESTSDASSSSSSTLALTSVTQSSYSQIVVTSITLTGNTSSSFTTSATETAGTTSNSTLHTSTNGGSKTFEKMSFGLLLSSFLSFVF